MKYYCLILLFCMAPTLLLPAQTPFEAPPAWAEKAIWYQIFVERFYNGDHNNDPVPANMNTIPMNQLTPTGWKLSNWTGNWYGKDSWWKKQDGSFTDMLQYRRYGGDFEGILQKLDYLQQLGITALYLNPINDAPSLHKYDARNYHHADIHFGPDPEGDLAIMARENPADPATWQWTSADKQFLKLIREAHQRGIRIILDYSWNHVGTTFWAWQDVLKQQAASPYKDWFDIRQLDDPATPANEFNYRGWLNIPHLPELKKTNITTERKGGYPYEGNISEAAKQHIFAVSKRWLAPDGDTSRGIDGFRLDVADHVGLGFWRDYRKFIRSVQPNAYLVGEIWWEEWPDRLMNPAPYTNGTVFDAVMFYQVYRPARSFFANVHNPITAEQFRDSLLFQWNRLRPETNRAMMNVASTHDAPRLLSCFYNPGKYKFRAGPAEDAAYHTGKPDAETYQRVRQYLVHLFTSIGAPQIWNGEEMGMWGGDDPDCRKPLWWKEFQFEPEEYNGVTDPVGFNQEQFNWYQQLIRIRKAYPVLVNGTMEFIHVKDKLLAYQRKNATQTMLIYFNTNKHPAHFYLPTKKQYKDLLTGKLHQHGRFRLNGLQSAILLQVP